MKKILVAIMAVLFAAPSFAQFNSGGFSLNESSVYYGIRLGMNIATLTGSDAPDLNSRVGLNLGGTVGVRVSEANPLFLESGLYYSSLGASKDKSSISLNYLELPILIKYGIQASDNIALLPFLGPTFRYGLFGGTIKTEGVGNEDTFDHYNRGDVGIKLGCGAEYNMIYLEVGYQFGIANIADFKINATDDATIHNGGLFINLGVNF